MRLNQTFAESKRGPHTMRTNLRDWLTRRGQPPQGTHQDSGQSAAQDAREGRANAIVVLRAEVRQLQQDITDLTKGWDNGTDQSDRQDATARLRAIEKALDLKQAELSRLQGRI
jgi:hypothetical protein